MEVIKRNTYLNHITESLNRGVMIILVGQRRVGKSFMLLQAKEWIEENKKNANILYINKELQAFDSIKDYHDLYEKVAKELPEGGDNYLLIDELQDICQYENALRSLQAENRCQIIATGSNAYLFSSELATRLSGRYIEIPIYSLTYSEFLLFHKLGDSDKSFQDYIRVGGLPGLCHYNIADENQVRDYMQGVYNTIMMRDIVAREQIRNVTFLENLLTFIADNAGKLISTKSIAKYMKQRDEKVSEALTSTYIRYLSNAFILSQVRRYDIHGKSLFDLIQKYYFEDHGLRNFICGFRVRSSVEKIMENIVRHHLMVSGFSVAVGILRNGEIDFVATKGDKVIYIQVTYLLASDETIEREFGNLVRIRDNYPKYVVSMDPVSGELSEYPGIRHIHLREFVKDVENW